MGYRSDVGYVIQGKREEMIPVIMTFRLTYDDPKYTMQALDECTYGIANGFLTVKFETHGKWYAEYTDVRNHNMFFDAFREAAETDGSSINGMFVRIGEDDTDAETRSYGEDPYGLVHIRRELEFEVEAGGSLASVLV